MNNGISVTIPLLVTSSIETLKDVYFIVEEEAPRKERCGNQSE